MALPPPGRETIIEELLPAGKTRQWRLVDEPGGTPRALVVGRSRSDGTLLLDCRPCGYRCRHIDLVRAALGRIGIAS
jgi:hypothetical protein